jgi:hypothetical protein
MVWSQNRAALRSRIAVVVGRPEVPGLASLLPWAKLALRIFELDASSGELPGSESGACGALPCFPRPLPFAPLTPPPVVRSCSPASPLDGRV